MNQRTKLMLDMCIAANYNNQISLEGNCSIFSGRIIVYIGFSCLDRNLQQDVASTSTDLDNLDNTTVITDLSYSYVPPCLEANQERTTNFSIPETSQHNVPHNIVFNNINIECVDTLVLPSTSPSLQKNQETPEECRQEDPSISIRDFDDSSESYVPLNHASTSSGSEFDDASPGNSSTITVSGETNNSQSGRAESHNGIALRRRKKRANPRDWKRSIVKRLRLSGKRYVNRSGKEVGEKQAKAVNCENCRYHCNQNFPEAVRVTLCREYWELADDKKQKMYLSSLIQNTPVLRTKNSAGTKRSTSRIFYLKNLAGERKRVCLKFLCATLAISHRVVELTMKRVSGSGLYIGDDGRKDKKAHNTTCEDDLTHVKSHIDTFPKVESHYCRKDSRKLYLASDLNLSIMYRLYRDDYCIKQKIKPVSLFVYRKIFHTYDPPLSFYVPKKDQCFRCNAYQSASDKGPLQEEWQLHKKAELDSLNMKDDDKKRAIEDKGITYRAITFDLQAILSVPFAGDNQIYYKRKLNVYNFTIMDAFQNDGFCYVWDECNGRKGSNEIGSCLLDYIFNLPETVTHVSSFSDTCGGQNRNQFIMTAMLYAVNKKENLETIDLKFMESGHSYLEADSIHATIERSRKHKKVYTTREWSLLISTAKVKPRAYKVNTLSFTDFYDLKELNERLIKNISHNTDGTKVNWIKIKWLRFQKSKSLSVQYKYDLSENRFFEMDVSKPKTKRRVGRKSTLNWYTIELKPKYTNKLPVSEEKKKDLLWLLSKRIIPEDYSQFIENIPTAKQLVNLESEEEESEEEEV